MQKHTANGSISAHDIFCSVRNRSGNDSGTIKKINNKSNKATSVPKQKKTTIIIVLFHRKTKQTKCNDKIFTIKSC